MARILVCHHGGDDPYATQSVVEALRRAFGRDSVVAEREVLPVASELDEYIERRVGGCDVALVVIGDLWLDLLEDDRDGSCSLMLREIEAALAAQMPVVPLLVGEAGLPSGGRLPAALESLPERQSAEVRAGPDLEAHLGRLVERLRKVLEPKETVFVSYRREDQPYAARIIVKALQSSFKVVFDIDSIPLGAFFREFIDREVGKCDAFLVVVGDRWLRILGERKDLAQDLVRVEIESALSRGRPVLPVLVGDAALPSAADLPLGLLSDLANKDAVEVRSGSKLDLHLQGLVERVAEVLDSTTSLRADDSDTVESARLGELASADVFISFAHEDKAAALQIAGRLESAGLKAWTDVSELQAGDDWVRRIDQAIRDCTVFVPCLSRSTAKAKQAFFRYEWKAAVERMQFFRPGVGYVFPVALDDIEQDEENIPQEFRKLFWVRLSSEGAMDELVRAIVEEVRAREIGEKRSS